MRILALAFLAALLAAAVPAGAQTATDLAGDARAFVTRQPLPGGGDIEVAVGEPDLRRIRVKAVLANDDPDGIAMLLQEPNCTLGLSDADPQYLLNALMRVIEETGVSDVNVTTSGCMGLCSREPLVTVELLGKEAIKYEKMDEMKMRQVFKRHVLEGEIQTPFVLAKGAEIVR